MATPYNSSHVQYDGRYFNETVLKEFHYIIYGNGTLSNNSHCYLTFGNYKPVLFSNGSVVNGSSCSSPIDPVEARGYLGIAFGVIFAVAIVLGTTCLHKHGATHLPVEKRFRLVSRRWQWYWYLITAACGLVSGLMAIDVDRDYIQDTALILQNVFFYVTLPAILASIWEMTRHWASFMERQIVDGDAWYFQPEDRRSKIEFYTPLVFYLFAFLTFFLSILRTWTPITRGSGESATDPRFRASSIFALIAFGIIIFSVSNSIKYYQPLSRRVPYKIHLSLLVVFIRIAYNIACAFEYSISPLKYNANNAYIYGLGYLPIVLVMSVMVFAAWREMNEDLKIKQLRRERDFRLDKELGIGKKKTALPGTNEVPKEII